MTNDRRMVPAGEDSCPKSRREDNKHGWEFDGDDPYVICAFCGERRDALTDRVIAPAAAPVLPAGPSDEEIERFRLYYFNDLPLGSSEFRSVLKYALARWGAQTEYDAEKVEALLGTLEAHEIESLSCDNDGERNCECVREAAAAVRSSRRPKGRAVDGWAAMIRGSAPAAFYLTEASAKEHAEVLIDGKVSRCRIEILDAPEEGR